MSSRAIPRTRAAWPPSCGPGRSRVNGAPGDMAAPFGGYKQSGNGREWGKYGFEEFLEIKAVLATSLPEAIATRGPRLGPRVPLRTTVAIASTL